MTRQGRQPRYDRMQADKRLIKIWEDAVRENPLILTISDKKKAIRFRFELYTVRRVLEAKQDPLFEAIRGMQVRMQQIKANAFQLVIEPSGAFIQEVLEETGRAEATESDADALFDALEKKQGERDDGT